MKPGDIVMIYDDPITKVMPEGEARLVREYEAADCDGRSRWKVHFLTDPPGVNYMRTIHEPLTNLPEEVKKKSKQDNLNQS